jgi:hypothetical protein
MPRPAAPLALLLAIALASSLVAWQEHRQLAAESPMLRKAALLAFENDTLREALAAAQQEAATAQNILRRSQIEHDVASIRQLPFGAPVAYEVLDHAGIRQVVAGKLSEVYTDQQIQDMSTGLSGFGLLPPNFPLKQTYINLLGEQIAAFYDQHQHKLFMFQDASLENAQNRVILAHELTHALQDQNFGLLKLPLETKDNDDRAAAASALIEGDATLVMSQYMARDLTWHTLTDTVAYSATQSMEQIRKAPRYLREMLVFPYLKGQQFCSAVYARGGFPALSAVYADPPASTAQILHPEKYFPETRENPIAVNIPDTGFQGRTPLDDNVLGEMGCRILFSQYVDSGTAEKAAAGWRGDRYLVFEGGNALIWHTVWRTPQDVEAAVNAITAMCSARFHTVFFRSGEDIVGSAVPGHFARIQLMPGNEMLFVLAPTNDTAQQLHDKFSTPAHG